MTCPRGTPATDLVGSLSRFRGRKNIERVDVSEPASITDGIAYRYATAIFELAKDEDLLPKIREDADALAAALNESADLRDLIRSPVYGREEQKAAIGAVADQMGLHALTGNTMRLMADKRRLFVLPNLIDALRALIAEENGEITADVIAARELSDDQRNRLAETLKTSVGRAVNINLSVDETLIGGLVVKVGSKMIDTSIRSKLDTLQNTMKEVG